MPRNRRRVTDTGLIHEASELVRRLETIAAEAVLPEDLVLRMAGVAKRLRRPESRAMAPVPSRSSSEVATWEWNLKTGEAICSPAQYRLWAVEPRNGDASPDAFLDRLHPDDRVKARELMARTRRGEGPVQFECRLVLPDGTARNLCTSYLLTRDAAGEPLSVIGLSQDVTEQEEAAQELRRAKEFAEQLIDSNQDGLVACDKELRVAAWNPAMEALSGLPRSEALGRHLNELFPFNIDVGQQQLMFEALSGQSVSSRNSRYFSAGTGRWCYLDARYSPLHDHRGKQTGALALFRDVTVVQRMMALQQLLTESGKVLFESLAPSDVLNSALSLIVPEFSDWCVIQVAPTVAGQEEARAYCAHADPLKAPVLKRLVDSASSELLTGAWGDEPEIAAVVPPSLLRLAAKDAGQLGAFQAIGFSSFVFVPVVLRSRRLGSLVLGKAQGAFSDEDFRAANEFAIQLSVALENGNLLTSAREMTAAREELMAVLSHDLKSPVTSIRLNAGLVLGIAGSSGSEPSPKIIRAARQIEQTSLRVAELISSVLDAASEDGRLALRCAEHSVSPIVSEVLDRFGAQSEESQVALASRVETDREIHCDRIRLQQVLSNLLSHAFRYTPQGGEVELAVHEQGDTLLFRISDTGPGVAPEDREGLFQKHLRPARLAARGGGLGLFIARSIVEAHGGRIWVGGDPGERNCLCFTLPLTASIGALPPTRIEQTLPTPPSTTKVLAPQGNTQERW